MRWPMLLLLFAAPAWAGYDVTTDSTTDDEFYNSSETECQYLNGETVDAGVLRCDDFEDGTAAPDSGAYAATSGADLNDGIARNDYHPTTCAPGDPADCDDPTGYANGFGRCGGAGAAGSDCAWTMGDLASGSGAGAMGDVDFAADAHFTELYIRWYNKWSSDYLWYTDSGCNEKELTINEGQRRVGGLWFMSCFVQSTGGSGAASAMQCLIPGEDTNRSSNVDSTTTSQGTWYAYEVRIKLNSSIDTADGILQIWRDDCGADGLGCTGAQTLTMNHTDITYIDSTFGPAQSGDEIGSVWFENWSNSASDAPPCGGTEGEEWKDQIIISENPIGWSTYGLSPSPSATGVVLSGGVSIQ